MQGSAADRAMVWGIEALWLFFLSHEAGRAVGWEAELVSHSSAAFFMDLLNFLKFYYFHLWERKII